MSYDPTIGRWTAQDPIGFEGGDPNLYRYVHNEPTDRVDPFGTDDGMGGSGGGLGRLPTPPVPSKSLPIPTGPKRDPNVEPARGDRRLDVQVNPTEGPPQDRLPTTITMPTGPRPGIFGPGSPNDPITTPSRTEQVVGPRRVRRRVLVGKMRVVVPGRRGRTRTEIIDIYEDIYELVPASPP